MRSATFYKDRRTLYGSLPGGRRARQRRQRNVQEIAERNKTIEDLLEQIAEIKD
jgi:uncharacterized protein YdeI (YjbR/CyaY-like superfamily)